MKKKTVLFLLLTAGVVSCASVIYAQIKTGQMREQLLEASNQLALQDTARMLDSTTIALLGDSINGFQQRVVQVEIDRDRLDQELRRRPVVRLAGRIQLDTVVVTDTVAIEKPGETEEFPLDKASGPFQVTGSFLYRPPTGTFDVRVSLNRPVNVGVRIGCESGPGVNTAHVVLTADDPFSVVPQQPLEQDPDVCNRPQMSFWRSLLPDFTPKGLLVETLKAGAYFALGKYLEEKFFDDSDDSPCYECVVR